MVQPAPTHQPPLHPLIAGGGGEARGVTLCRSRTGARLQHRSAGMHTCTATAQEGSRCSRMALCVATAHPNLVAATRYRAVCTAARCYRRQNAVVRCCRARVARGSAAPPHSLLHGGGLLPRVSTRRCGAAAELSTRQHGAAAQIWRQHGPAASRSARKAIFSIILDLRPNFRSLFLL